MRKALARLAVLLLVAAAPVGVYLAPGEPPPYPTHWDARVLDVVHFVEQQRGLTFEHPVEVRFLDDAAFRRKVSVPAGDAQERKQDQQLVASMRALGLVTGSPDLRKSADDLAQAGVVGVYLNEEKTLYVRGTELTPYVRATVAHELTHALQDQHFDLDAMFATPDADPNAVRALVEGDAMRVESAYQAQLSPADQKAYGEAEQAAGARADATKVPAALEHETLFPYDFGPTMLDALVALGGNDAVDAAFRHPPLVDAQVVDPREYPTRWRGPHVPAPHLPHGAERLDSPQPFGEVTLLEVLGSTNGYRVAWDDVQGWRGDTWEPYRQGGRTCVAVDVAMADGDAAQRLAYGLDQWALQLPGATVTQDGSRVVLRSCDPGSSHTMPAVLPDPYDVLAARAGLIHDLMDKGGWGFKGARCVSDHVLARVGAQAFLGGGSTTPVPADQVRRVFAAAAQDC